MDNLIPSITVPNLNNPTPDKGVNGTVSEAPDELLQNIKNGDNLFIEIRGQLLNSLNTSVKITINNQLMEIPLNIKTDEALLLETGKNNEAVAKVVANNNGGLELKFISVNNDKPEKYIAAPKNVPVQNNTAEVITHDIGKFKTDTILAPLKVSTVVENMVAKMDLPPEIKQNIIESLDKSLIKFNISSLATTENKVLSGQTEAAPKVQSSLPQAFQNVKEHIENILQNFSDKIQKHPVTPANIRDVVSQIKAELLPLKSMQIMGEVSVLGESNVLSIKTPIGNILSETPLKITEGTKIVLDVSGFIVSKTEDSVSENIHTMFTSKKLLEDLKLPLSLFSTQQLSSLNNSHDSAVKTLLAILKPLAVMGREDLVSKIIAKIPAQDENMLSNLVSIVKGISSNNLNEWLGKDVVEQLKTSGLEGKEVLSKLTGFIQSHNNEGQSWRVIEIPFFNGDTMSQIRVAIKKMQDEEENAKKENKKNKYGTRFVVDTTFTKLGGFQFDGFSFEKDKRFDLIIRTEREVPQGLCADMMRIFKNTLHEVDYIGNVKINVKENFIKVCEDELKNQSLHKGIYI